MKVTIKHLCGTSREVADLARTTIGLKGGDKEISDEYMRKLYLCEHSPIRSQMYKVTFEDIPYSNGMHFARHKIGIEHYFSTQREDRTGISRDERSQTDPVLYEAVLNSQAIITISRKRLCYCADEVTIKAWEMFLQELKKINYPLYQACVKECVYRGFCPEYQSCGYYKSEAYEFEIEKYRKDINK